MATIDKVSLDIAVVLGTTAMPVHQVLRLGRGAIIELDSGEDDEVKILANNFPVAKGTVIVSGNKIAVEVKEMLPRAPDARGQTAGKQGLPKALTRPCRPVVDLLHRAPSPGAGHRDSPHMRSWRNW